MIFVFKTSVSNTPEIEKVKPLLNKHLENAKWNFDLEDCDHILRIDSLKEITQRTIDILRSSGFDCQELED